MSTPSKPTARPTHMLSHRPPWPACGPAGRRLPSPTASFATLLDVVNHPYDGHLNLNLSAADKKDLIEFLKGI